MRLIDADEIMRALSIFNDTENGNSHFLNGIETAKELIEDAPTINTFHVIDRKKVIEELETCLTASCRGKSGYCPIPDEIWDNLDEVLELLKNRSRDYEAWAKEIGVHTCVNCKRYYSATEYGTDCPIMNVYAVPKDGYCHLWEPEDWRVDDDKR